MKASIITLLCLSTSLLAEDGKAVYNTYCSACHAPDGKGVEGAAPPLANSEWLQGGAERAAQIILKGLQGKITVDNKSYNLVMPPQSALNDAQVAAVTNYIRSSWGHNEKPIDEAFVTKQRNESKNQALMWDADKLLELYPLSNAAIPIQHLISTSKMGRFRSTDDLDKNNKKTSVEEEQGGLIDPSQGGKNNSHYGVIWSGTLEAPEKGEYTFSYFTKNPATVSINGNRIIDRNGLKKHKLSKPSTSTIELPKGNFDIEIRYVHKKNTDAIVQLYWSGPSFNNKPLHNTSTAQAPPSIKLTPKDGNAIVHRNFISDTEPRGIAVGYSEKLNLVFSADTLNLDYLWQGDFLDVGTMWTGRAKDEVAIPLQPTIHRLNQGSAFNILKSPNAKWNTPDPKQLKTQFKGYKLNSKDQPTFYYQINGIQFTDALIPSKDGKKLSRTIEYDTSNTKGPFSKIYLRLANKKPIDVKNPRLFNLDKNFAIRVVSSNADPLIRNEDVLLPLPLNTSKQSIQIDYLWK